jgi:hypothetical protein
VKARGGTNTTCWLQAWQTKETAGLSTIGGQQFMFICRRLKCKKNSWQAGVFGSASRLAGDFWAEVDPGC